MEGRFPRRGARLGWAAIRSPWNGVFFNEPERLVIGFEHAKHDNVRLEWNEQSRGGGFLPTVVSRVSTVTYRSTRCSVCRPYKGNWGLMKEEENLIKFNSGLLTASRPV
jgi:hypothetical protein